MPVAEEQLTFERNEADHIAIKEQMVEGFERVREDVAGIKDDIKVLNVAITKLLVIEERQASLSRMSEQNTQSINEMWVELSKIRDENTSLRVKLAEAQGVNHERGKVVWQLVTLAVVVVGGLIVALGGGA